MDKTGKYCYVAEPFHCDFSHRLFMSQLGNHLLNASEFHANERGFGMEVLAPEQDMGAVEAGCRDGGDAEAVLRILCRDVD